MEEGTAATRAELEQRAESRGSVFDPMVHFFTHSNVVNGHPHGPMVVDLFRGDRLGFIGQEDAQQQQQPLVSIHHPCRKNEVRICNMLLKTATHLYDSSHLWAGWCAG